MSGRDDANQGQLPEPLEKIGEHGVRSSAASARNPLLVVRPRYFQHSRMHCGLEHEGRIELVERRWFDEPPVEQANSRRTDNPSRQLASRPRHHKQSEGSSTTSKRRPTNGIAHENANAIRMPNISTPLRSGLMSVSANHHDVKKPVPNGAAQMSNGSCSLSDAEILASQRPQLVRGVTGFGKSLS